MIEIIFPSLGVVLTNIFGLNILRSYLINREKLINEYNEILFYIIIFNVYFWLFYSIVIKDIFIFFSCISSIIASFGFIQIMYKHMKPEKLIYIESISIICLLYLLTIIFLLNFTSIGLYKVQQIVGSSCVVSTITVNITPLLIIKQVITTQNTDLIYLPQIFINSINYLCWFIYSTINYNVFLLITNCVSLILCLFQIIVYVFIRIKINNKILPIVN